MTHPTDFHTCVMKKHVFSLLSLMEISSLIVVIVQESLQSRCFHSNFPFTKGWAWKLIFSFLLHFHTEETFLQYFQAILKLQNYLKIFKKCFFDAERSQWIVDDLHFVISIFCPVTFTIPQSTSAGSHRYRCPPLSLSRRPHGVCQSLHQYFIMLKIMTLFHEIELNIHKRFIKNKYLLSSA